jgi:S-adenosylmethionine-dependent methyltransferase
VREDGEMVGFESGERQWLERLGSLRNVVRQELIARQLADHVAAGMTVLDVGCGQGTQALRLAALGCEVTGVDPSADLLARARHDAARADLAVELIRGRVEDLDTILAPKRTFDVVCAHGLVMYLDDRAAALAALTARLAPDGRLSFTVRNGHALALRPGLRRQWSAVLAAFDDQDHGHGHGHGHEYVNELGVRARADQVGDIRHDLASAAPGMSIVDWFGVRVFNDAVPADAEVPDDEDLVALLDAEDRAGRRDPYRWMAAQLHFVAVRSDGSDAPTLRPARSGDAGAVADVWLRSRYASIPAIPMPVHSDDEVRGYFSETVLPNHEVWVGQDARAGIVALLVLDEDRVDHLYVDPMWTGRHLGTRLVDLAKQRRPQYLQLWTFATNTGARRFYERHGFVAVESSAGDNEEGAPDVRYEWRPTITALERDPR